MKTLNYKTIFKLLENSNLLMAVFDSNKRLIEFNQPFFYYAETMGRIELEKNLDFVKQLDQSLKLKCNELLKRCLNGERIKEIVQYPFRSLTLHLKIHLNPLDIEEHTPGVFMLLEDVTDLYEMQKKLDVYNKELEKIVRARSFQLVNTNKILLASNLKLEEALMKLKLTQDQLIGKEKLAQLGSLSAGLCHEINNPLNFIKGSVELLRKPIDKKDSSIKNSANLFKIIDEGVGRISDIVKSLSTFSRNRHSCDEICDIESITKNCISVLKNQLAKNVRVILKSEVKSAYVYGDSSDLHHAIFNLLLNAKQSILKDGLIEIDLKVSESRLDSYNKRYWSRNGK